jgi:cell division protease FtsH
MLGIPIHGVSLRQVGRQRGGVYAKLSARFMSAADVHNHLVMLLSGRAAEEVILHRVTSAAGGSGGSDLGTATRVAAAAAAEMGLEDDYGLLWTELGDRPHEIRRVFAGDPPLAALVRERLANAYGTALNLMKMHQRAVLELAKQLRERMALGPDEVASTLRAAGCRS